MKTPVIHHRRKLLLHTIAGSLFAIATALLSITFAQTPIPTPQSPTPWPPASDADKLQVAKVIVQAMNDSTNATGFPGLRKKLASPGTARQEIQDRLDAIHGNKVKLPREDEGIIVFFVPDSTPGSSGGGGARYYQNFYYSVFYLPSAPETGNDLDLLNKHLRCCYEPWALKAAASPTPTPQ